MKPVYLKSIRAWDPHRHPKQIGERYRIDEKDRLDCPYFSVCTWDFIINHRPGGYLEEITEEEYYSSSTSYELY